ncbi:MAG: Acg family FMN-binding oxidoreductase [Acidimicrobiales bacterium]
MNAEALRHVVELATRAPSVHNTQPWHFAGRADPDGEITGIDALADRERVLEVIDPEGRELHMSCGAAIEFARLGVRSLGLACAVELFPDVARRDLLALLDIGEEEPPTDEELQLIAAVPDRYTARERFDDTPVPDDLVIRLEEAVAEVGTWLRVLGDRADEVTLAVLLARSDEIERHDTRYESELTTWLHRPQSSGDGIPPVATVSTQERASSFQLREMESDIEVPRALDQGRPPEEPLPAEHPLVCIIGTPDDDPRAWLQAGQALGRLLLEAAAFGVQASPMTQVTEVPSVRAMLAAGLGLVGHPQIVLRMGYAHGHPSTPRRPMDLVLDLPSP